MLGANWIDEIDPTKPEGDTEKVSALDDYVRMLATVLTNQFTGFTGQAVTATEANLNAAGAIAVAAAANGGVVYGDTITANGGLVFQDEVGAANGVASLDGSGKLPQAQLPNLDYLPAPSTTVMLFVQLVPPVGWVGQVFFTDYALRLVANNSTGGSVVGTQAFSARFAAGRTTSTTVGADYDDAAGVSFQAAKRLHRHTLDMDVRYTDVISGVKD